MNKTLIAMVIIATSTIVSCTKEQKQAPSKSSSSQGTMKPMNSGTTRDMPATGAYKAWIANAVVTPNPLRLDNFIAGFAQQEPQYNLLNFTMVNVSIDGLGQDSYGIICDLKDPNVPLDGGIYTDPNTGDQFRYGWVLGNDGYFYPGKFWLIGGVWEFFAFDQRDQQINNMYPYDSGIDMGSLALVLRGFNYLA